MDDALLARRCAGIELLRNDLWYGRVFVRVFGSAADNHYGLWKEFGETWILQFGIYLCFFFAWQHEYCCLNGTNVMREM